MQAAITVKETTEVTEVATQLETEKKLLNQKAAELEEQKRAMEAERSVIQASQNVRENETSALEAKFKNLDEREAQLSANETDLRNRVGCFYGTAIQLLLAAVCVILLTDYGRVADTTERASR